MLLVVSEVFAVTSLASSVDPVAMYEVGVASTLPLVLLRKLENWATNDRYSQIAKRMAWLSY